jgi:Fe2+ transport system protein FeoA
MEKKLSEFMPNEKGRVKNVTAEGKIRRRLFDMGVTPGADIIMRKTAPLGDPLEVTVRGYELSLRKSEAETVVLEIVAAAGK